MDSNDASKGWEDVEYRDVASLLAFDVLLQIHGTENREADDGAVGDLEESRDKLRVSKALDDEGAEITHRPVDDLCRQAEEEEDPRLGIDESFNYLVAFEVRIFDPRVVVPKSFDREFLLFRGQPASMLRLVIHSSLCNRNLVRLTRSRGSRLG